MAQKIITELVDDLDGSTAAETVRFGLDNTSYEIDLTAVHATELRTALQAYVSAGRRARSTSTVSRPVVVGVRNSRDELDRMRVWLREQGEKVSDRGRIPARLQELYRASHR